MERGGGLRTGQGRPGTPPARRMPDVKERDQRDVRETGGLLIRWSGVARSPRVDGGRSMFPRGAGANLLPSLAETRARVVIVRALRLGDLLCAVPAFRALRAALPHAHLTLIGLPLAREFVRRCAYLDAFEEFPGYPGIADQPYDAGRTLAFLSRMQASHIDLAIQLHGSGVFSNPFALLLGARRTVGFTRSGEIDLGLDLAIPYPQQGHESERLLTLTRALGAPDRGHESEFLLLPEDHAELATLRSLQPLLASGRPLVGLHPGAKVRTRRWMPERFAAVADALAVERGAAIVLTGGRDEWETCEMVRAHMRADALNLAGSTSLGALAALLSRLDLVVANDSGPAHLAAAVGTRSVVIFGAAQAETWAARDTRRHRALSVPVPCRPCYVAECPIGYRCLDAITPGAVLEQALALLDAGAASGTGGRRAHA